MKNGLSTLYRFLRPLLYTVDPERAHHAAVRLGGWLGTQSWARSLLYALCRPSDPRLQVSAMGLDFPTPLGVAAGFDKNGMLVPILAALGFGFVEVGTVTPRPWSGNPKPRLFRLPADDALVNRLGLPSDGGCAVARRLRNGVGVPVGVNVGRVHDRPDADAVQDYVEAIRQVANVASYVAINVSCPNTDDRDTFEAANLQRFEQLMTAVAVALRPQHAEATHGLGRPWVVKLSPDVTWPHMREMVDIALARGASGFALSNTTRAREDLATPMNRVRAIGTGGLSGRPLRRRANLAMRLLRRHVGDTVTLIGVGGIFDACDVRERLEAGATLVQLYTGLVYGGPFVARDINRALAALTTTTG